MLSLTDLGWNPQRSAALRTDAALGRVSTVDRGSASVLTRGGPVRVRIPNRLLSTQDTDHIPTVWDWVLLHDEEIDRVLDRTTAVTRTVAGERTRAQVVAANVDVVFVVDDASAPPKGQRIERYLALAWERRRRYGHPGWLRGVRARVPPSGEVTIRSGRQRISLHKAMAGRTVTVWAGRRSIHLSLDGHVGRTVASRLRPEDLRHLAMRGARPAGAEPAKPAFGRANGTPVPAVGQAVEIERIITKDGTVTIAGNRHLIGFAWAGRRVALRLDGHLMHAVLDNALIGTWPCPISTNQLAQLKGARRPATQLPPPPLPAGSLRAQRKVHVNGRIMVAKQSIKLGPRYAGKLVTVIVEDTHLRVLHGEEEIAVRPRRSLTPITRFHVRCQGRNRSSLS